MKMVSNHRRAPVKDVVKPTVKSTAWFAHPEQILVSLLSSKEETARRFAVRTILDRIRGMSGVGDTSVRAYRIPKLNWEVEKLEELIN